MKIQQLILLVVCFWGSVNVSHGHQFNDLDLSLSVTLSSDAVILEYRIWYGPLLIPSLKLDADGNTILEEAELFTYLNRSSQEVLENIEIEINGLTVEAQTLTATISNAGTFPDMSLDIALWFTVELPQPLPEQRQLLIRDKNFSIFGSDRKSVLINTASWANDLTVLREGDDILFFYTNGKGFAINEKLVNENQSRTENTFPAKLEQENRLTRFIQSSSMSPGVLLTMFVTAFLLGATHALSPGHGKAMVAAYLVGTEGRKRDAVILGLVVTFTHVISVIVMGLVVLYLANYVLPEQILPWLTFFSGGLIILTSLLLVRRNMMHTHHHHGHVNDTADTSNQHNSSAHHHHEYGGTGIFSLLSLGIAGGILPCPSAMVVLLVSISLHKIGLGLALITVFSLGLATILVAIGLAVVSIAGFASSVSRFTPIIKVLPFFSASIVMIVGVIITIQGLIETGVLLGI